MIREDHLQGLLANAYPLDRYIDSDELITALIKDGYMTYDCGEYYITERGLKVGGHLKPIHIKNMENSMMAVLHILKTKNIVYINNDDEIFFTKKGAELLGLI